MAKKSSLNVKSNFFGFIKFIIFILLIPVLAAVTISFRKELTELKTIYYHSFESGIFVYVLLNFFLTDFVWLYKFGQGISTELFKFWDAFAKVAPYIFPIFTALTMLFYYVVVRVMNVGPNQGVWFFVIGFTFAMHLVMTARELYENDSSSYKPNYLFEMALVYIVNILLMVQLLNVTAWKFSLVSFAQTVIDLTHDFYLIIYSKFF